MTEIRFPSAQFIWTTAALLLALCVSTTAAQTPEMPVVDGQLGRCSASFTVTDTEKNPIYNARIVVLIRYGFLGLRKLELEVGTNSDGKARVAGLPEQTKNPLEFDISSKGLHKQVVLDPSLKCNGTYEVTLQAP